MKRRTFLTATASAVVAGSTLRTNQALASDPLVKGLPLVPPDRRKINVAFAIADGANVMDIAGPWEVFQDVLLRDHGKDTEATVPFKLYTVAASAETINASGGFQIVPNFTVDTAPKPDLISVGAINNNPLLTKWLAETAPKTDVTMSVCTGAFQLGHAGLLDGLMATTHHEFYDRFSKSFPKMKLFRDTRFVENERISTAGGLTSGIDLALRIVERYFGRKVAQTTADFMEYRGIGWQV